MAARYFKDAPAFRAWLRAHHSTRRELILGFYKRHSGRKGITYAEAIDEALSFGWIDGILRRVDDDRYCMRFSPRARNSIWSAVNIRKAKALVKSGRMARPGLEAFRAQKKNTGQYSYENRPREMPGEYARRFKRDAAAWAFFGAQTPSYRRLATWFIVSAVKEETRLKRLDALIAASAKGLRIDEIAPGRKKYE